MPQRVLNEDWKITITVKSEIGAMVPFSRVKNPGK